MSATIISAAPVRGAFADRELDAVNGYATLAIGLASIAICCWLTYIGFRSTQWFSRSGLDWLSPIIIAVVLPSGFSRDSSCFSRTKASSVYCSVSYVGTEHRPGFWWVNPFNSKEIVSRRLETLESGPLKVNDAVGNPIDIGAVIVWRVEDAAKALLEVVAYASYVKAQSETALRRMVSVHPYDQVETEEADRQGEPPASGAGKPGHDRAPVSTVSLRDGGDAVMKPCCRRSGHAWSRSASRCSKREFLTSLIGPRFPAPCFGSRRPAPWSAARLCVLASLASRLAH